jgi:hypothetical protein
MPVRHRDICRITDDQKIVDSGVVLPLWWNKDMEITDNRGNVLTVDELAIPNGYINVKHYGVKGDGVTYDTGAIQALLGVDENGRPEHPRLYFPYGSYLIDELIFDGMGWHIIGDGGINPSFYMEQDPKFGDYYKATVFKSVAQEVDTNKALFNIGGEHYHMGSVFENITLDGSNRVNGMALSTESGGPVIFGSTFRNIGITNVQSGIIIKDSPTVAYRNSFKDILINRVYNKGVFIGAGSIGQMSFNDIEITEIYDGGIAIEVYGSNISFRDFGIEGTVDIEGSQILLSNGIAMDCHYTTQTPLNAVFKLGNTTNCTGITLENIIVTNWPYTVCDYGVLIGEHADNIIIRNFLNTDSTNYPRYAVAFENGTPVNTTILENITSDGFKAKDYLPMNKNLKTHGGNFLDGYNPNYAEYALGGVPSEAILESGFGLPVNNKGKTFIFKDTGTGGKIYDIYCDGEKYWILERAGAA